ncbi:MAG: zinc metallopeptidase [Schleiferiaceae bacterium]|nr:zinc metallopeptidase [Schleiferiaceae bacterium]
MFILIIVVFMALGFYVQNRLKSRFKKYSKELLHNGMSGAQVAEAMLDHYGISSVNVVSVPGKLTDHYNPANRTVNLSPEVYEGRNVASAAIAAHECGHAVQHSTAYFWLGMRTKMVPVVNASSQIMRMVFFASLFGMGLLGLGYSNILILLITVQAVIASFAFVTLPVEYDASRRALVWLKGAGITNPHNHGMAEDALKWAARTYLVAAIAAATQLLYYVMLYMRRN